MPAAAHPSAVRPSNRRTVRPFPSLPACRWASLVRAFRVVRGGKRVVSYQLSVLCSPCFYSSLGPRPSLLVGQSCAFGSRSSALPRREAILLFSRRSRISRLLSVTHVSCLAVRSPVFLGVLCVSAREESVSAPRHAVTRDEIRSPKPHAPKHACPIRQQRFGHWGLVLWICFGFPFPLWRGRTSNFEFLRQG